MGVLGDDAVERFDVFQGAAHELGVGDAHAVVGEDPDFGRGVRHGAEFGEAFAFQADGDRPDRVDVAVSGVPAQPPDLFDDAGSVGDGVGVGHGVDRGVSAHGGSPRPSGDGFCVFASGSRRWVWRSTGPGRAGPGGVDHFGAVSGRSGPIAIRPWASSRSVGSPRDAGVADQVARGGRHRGSPGFPVCGWHRRAAVQHGHADADTVGHLFGDGGAAESATSAEISCRGPWGPGA